MEKNDETNAAVGEFEFPEEIIHQIQSFMSQREAAGTTLVSKSWYGAWSTRPDLSFDHHELGERLPEYARKTLQRYEHLNLSIQTFRLWLQMDDSLARELILKAIKLGAIDLTIECTKWSFVLPDEVLESQTLTRLSASCYTIDLERMNKPLTSSNLKSLTLYSIVAKGDFSDLSRRFPLLEELRMQLVHLNTEDNLWLQFPCLKILVIRSCFFKDKANGEGVIRICSPSLEGVAISLCMSAKAKFEFDVPNIRIFKFEGYDVPLLELKTSSSREWELDIDIICSGFVGSALWLQLFKQFLKVLSPCRVFLALYIRDSQLGVEDGFVGDDLAVPVVEDLTISGKVSPAFLNALFRSFRPNFVDIERRCVLGMEKEDVEQFQYLSSLPWNTFLDDSILLDDSISRDDWEEEFVRFQL